MRLDRWLRLKIGKIPQGLVEKYLRTGKIKLNRKKVKSSFKVKTKDEINIFNIEFKETIQQKKIKFLPSKEIIKSNEDQIIDNNDNFVVLNKASGISVQGGTKSKKNLVDIFAKSEIFEGTKPYSVHRLDKDTSGVFIMAIIKTPEVSLSNLCTEYGFVPSKISLLAKISTRFFFDLVPPCTDMPDALFKTTKLSLLSII